ncbi:GNAT family N-acetyltransferase [Paenibacillus mendelii]|uniref:GNAT family N-acetyltransferase n=1 Tax=Paenibacillus mendelii TaxID=206163 RepID=A0ABV6J7S4_9BACL|nr:GNAT family N-acetyltransferase [Paenibacillus mendelii]MCQ6561411.1 GNAT family N-acetyltransferase [Paenibacillus mendelii]
MLEKLVPHDTVFAQGPFMSHEARYNLIHLIGERQEGATCFKTVDGRMIYAQSHGHPAWLWLSDDVRSEERCMIMKELAHRIQRTVLPGITGDPKTVKMFAEIYSEASGLPYHTRMMMEAYVCPEVNRPVGVQGSLRLASRQDIEVIAAFLAGFSEGAYGVVVDPASQVPAAEQMVEAGGLYVWMVPGKPVSMANIAHRSPRHARINAVYTPPEERHKGFASALVAEMCAVVMRENLEPMLYEDLMNPASNKVYKNIGFVECGTIAAIGFGQS